MDLNSIQEIFDNQMEYLQDNWRKSASSWPNRFKWMVVILSFFSFLIVGYFVFLKNEILAYETNVRQEEFLKQDYMEETRRIAQLPYDKDYLKKLKDFHSKYLQDTIPFEENGSQIIKIINSISAKHSLKIERISPLKKETQDFYIEVPFYIEFSGNFSSIRKMCTELVSTSRFLNISLVSVGSETRIGEDKPEVYIKYMFRVSYYYVRDPESYKSYL